MALRPGDKADYHDYSAGEVVAYVNSTWVVNALRIAGLEDPLNETDIVNMRPGKTGIPGGKKSTLDKFESDLERMGKLDELKSRALALDPVMPWMALALYHRGMLGSAHKNWATDMSESKSIPENIQERFVQLQLEGMRPSNVVIDAGCGWGRFAHLLIPFLNNGHYFGLEFDRFELRAFIQLEIGVEGEALEAKSPTFIQSGVFDFDQLLSGASRQQRLRADIIIFSSVLKSTMNMGLKLLALCHAAGALVEGGKVVIFNDCDKRQMTSEIAQVVTGFHPMSVTAKEPETCVIMRDRSPRPSCKRFEDPKASKAAQAAVRELFAQSKVNRSMGPNGGGGPFQTASSTKRYRSARNHSYTKFPSKQIKRHDFRTKPTKDKSTNLPPAVAPA